MDRKTIAVFAAAVMICAVSSSCSEKETPLTEESVPTVSISETSLTTEPTEAAVVTSAAISEELSDHDRAIKLAAAFTENSQSEYVLYDLDLDGIPELMKKIGFMDTIGWQIYKLTGDDVLDLGYMQLFTDTDIEDYLKPEYYHGDELTLESGIHIYRNTQNDEIFYVTEYITEMHTLGHAAGVRYDIYADKLASTELYRCDFYTYDDCGASGNRYIAHNILDGEQASPMFRVNCNSEGFLYCNEFGDYLSGYEYLGMIDTENSYTSEKYDSFYDYAKTVSIPEKTKEERIFTETGELVTVCGEEYYADTYKVEIDIRNGDNIDLSELKLLPKLEKLSIRNISDEEIDLSPLAEIDTITELLLFKHYDHPNEGDFDYSSLTEMDNILITNAPIEYTAQMSSVKFADTAPDSDDPDGYAPFYDMEQLEAVTYCCFQVDNGQIDKLAEHRPDLLLIYVP